MSATSSQDDDGTGVGYRLAARRLDLGDHVGGGSRLVTGRAVAAHAGVVDDDRGAVRGERQAVAAPDTSPTAGDQDDASGQVLAVIGAPLLEQCGDEPPCAGPSRRRAGPHGRIR